MPWGAERGGAGRGPPPARPDPPRQPDPPQARFGAPPTPYSAPMKG